MCAKLNALLHLQDEDDGGDGSDDDSGDDDEDDDDEEAEQKPPAKKAKVSSHVQMGIACYVVCFACLALNIRHQRQAFFGCHGCLSLQGL